MPEWSEGEIEMTASPTIIHINYFKRNILYYCRTITFMHFIFYILAIFKLFFHLTIY